MGWKFGDTKLGKGEGHVVETTGGKNNLLMVGKDMVQITYIRKDAQCVNTCYKSDVATNDQSHSCNPWRILACHGTCRIAGLICCYSHKIKDAVFEFPGTLKCLFLFLLLDTFTHGHGDILLWYLVMMQ